MESKVHFADDVLAGCLTLPHLGKTPTPSRNAYCRLVYMDFPSGMRVGRVRRFSAYCSPAPCQGCISQGAQAPERPPSPDTAAVQAVRPTGMSPGWPSLHCAPKFLTLPSVSQGASDLKLVFQSTLPPQGATCIQRCNTRQTAISIHTPIVGSNYTWMSAFLQFSDFNPRSHGGEQL